MALTVQCIFVTFCNKTRHTATEDYDVLEVALGNWAWRRSTASERCKLLKSDGDFFEDDHHSGHPW